MSKAQIKALVKSLGGTNRHNPKNDYILVFDFKNGTSVSVNLEMQDVSVWGRTDGGDGMVHARTPGLEADIRLACKKAKTSRVIPIANL